MDAQATGLCDSFVDKVKQVKVKVEHSLHGTSSDNRLTEPTLIQPQHSLKSIACVTASDVERLIKSAPMPLTCKPRHLINYQFLLLSRAMRSFRPSLHTSPTSSKAGRFPSAWKAGLVAPLHIKLGHNNNKELQANN